jgi:alpha-2-macroglobulin
LFTDSESGAVDLKRDLPHTITEWIGTTICVSSHHGLGIAPPTHITAFQPFFLDYTMPYSIKRGEVVQLKVSLFNFLSFNLPVCIWLFKFIKSESDVLLHNQSPVSKISGLQLFEM